LDAPVVAVLWQEALARVHHVKLLPGCNLALGLAVWLIYIVDRTLDGFTDTPESQLSARHAFYQRHRLWVIGLVVPALCGGLLWLGLTVIPEGVMWRGAALAFLVGLYLAHYSVPRQQRFVHLVGNVVLGIAALAVLVVFPLPLEVRLLFGLLLVLLVARSALGRGNSLPKELMCGYLFALGCGLCVRYLSFDDYAGPFSPETLLMALLFGLNCVAISCYERKTDRAFDPGAIFQLWPGVARVYPLLLITLGALSAFTIQQNWSREILAFGITVFLSALLLGGVHWLSRRISADLARVLADVALMLPIAVFYWCV
jgi:hypothetical protein